MARDLDPAEARDRLMRVLERNGIEYNVRRHVEETWIFTSKLYQGKASPDRTFRPPGQRTGVACQPYLCEWRKSASYLRINLTG
jgi:hypothetical protein